MASYIESINENIDRTNDTLVILVGESGVGKSTFSNFVDLANITYTSSGAIIDELAKLGLADNHENIHKFASEKYSENPGWQIEKIMARIATRGVLILDGPRRVREVELLREQPINSPIVKISAPKELRLSRLAIRDQVDEVEFQQILYDESHETELDKILAMADVEIVNDEGLDVLQAQALSLRNFIKELESQGGKRCG